MQTIKRLYEDICESAYWDGYWRVSQRRYDRTDPQVQPGYYYNNLSEEIKERLRKELTSEIIRTSVLNLFLKCGPRLLESIAEAI
jgi:catalase